MAYDPEMAKNFLLLVSASRPSQKMHNIPRYRNSFKSMWRTNKYKISLSISLEVDFSYGRNYVSQDYWTDFSRFCAYRGKWNIYINIDKTLLTHFRSFVTWKNYIILPQLVPCNCSLKWSAGTSKKCYVGIYFFRG